ncbi:MAG: hypothetical protein KJO82_07460 [Gammaproteobacteria bacterium]|nr:hypothetical protein [Gammaproteobacteria bacterium]
MGVMIGTCGAELRGGNAGGTNFALRCTGIVFEGMQSRAELRANQQHGKQ